MRYIKSCGFVVFKRIDNANYYLLIQSVNGDVGFPKGHMESGENEIQTAHRELKEETNVEVLLQDGFRIQIEYKMPNINDAIKQSVYYLGKCIKDDIVVQEKEVKEASFISYEKAIELLTFNETKEILKQAEDFINKQIYKC